MMRAVIVVWFLLQILSATEINQKMIISAHLETEKAAQSLYDIEKFFQENIALKSLQRQHNLTLGMELLDPYVVVTVRPITKTMVKNKLHYLLQKKFPQSFVVDNSSIINNTKIDTTLQSKKTIAEKNIGTFVEKKSIGKQIKTFWRALDSAWIGLILLALAGFMLVYRSARQMSKIKSLQEEVIQYQTKIEGEMKHMEHKGV